ncbi:hypothetical protein SORBI_3007G069450 [Sorghum bicolor]|uniref:Uncharacterized protein n=1 Tax=Sorghum bicolor TaxID=4558 RepID=A0A1Z5R8X9_SORBI|nr:hypothetical protein SORBI_3007G069450 [Sorghum bicolor]
MAKKARESPTPHRLRRRAVPAGALAARERCPCI